MEERGRRGRKLVWAERESRERTIEKGEVHDQ